MFNHHRLKSIAAAIWPHCPMLVLLIGFWALPSRLSAEDPPGPPPLLTEVREALKVGSRQRALSIVETSETVKNDKKYIPYALLDIARSFYEAKNLKKSEEILSKIITRYPDSPIVSLAWCGLGEVYRDMGDDKQMVAALENGLIAPRVETGIGIMDASDSQNRAHEMLGSHYMTIKQWKKALAIWENWKPESWCGTCAMEMESHRQTNIMVCRLQLGKHAECIKAVVDHLRGDKSNHQRATTYQAYLTYLIYERAGQSRDLIALASAAESKRVDRRENDPVIDAIRFCEQLQVLEDRRAIGPLIELMGKEQTHERPVMMERYQWRSRAAADALSRCGPKAVAGLVQVIANKRKESVTAPPAWIYYALGRHPSPAALQVLKDVQLRKEAGWDEIGDLYFALAMKGKDGASALERLEPIASKFGDLAKKDVSSGLAWIEFENGWPVAKGGSLPGEFDLKIGPLEELLKK